MTFLIDSNVWMQLLRNREHAPSVQVFLSTVPTDSLAVTDFSLHSIGVAMGRFGQGTRFAEFVNDVVVVGRLPVIRLTAGQLMKVPAVQEQQRLDFDDAYQYLAAEQHDLTLVSYDTDFDRTQRGRILPEQALKRLTEEP